MTALTSVHSGRAAAALSTPGSSLIIFFVTKLWRELFKELLSSYQPELHYMRGPGPRWREKHGAVSARDGGIRVSVQELRTDLRTNTSDHERRAIAKRMSRETGTLAAVDRERGHTQAREIVEARRVLIAELEQRRRVSCDCDHGLSEGAYLAT